MKFKYSMYRVVSNEVIREHYINMAKYELPPDVARQIYSILLDICNFFRY